MYSDFSYVNIITEYEKLVDNKICNRGELARNIFFFSELIFFWAGIDTIGSVLVASPTFHL